MVRLLPQLISFRFMEQKGFLHQQILPVLVVGESQAGWIRMETFGCSAELIIQAIRLTFGSMICRFSNGHGWLDLQAIILREYSAIKVLPVLRMLREHVMN